MHSTLHTERIEGVSCVVPNRVGEVDSGSPHWYISYNDHDIEIYGSATTALVLGQMEYFLLLNGDHRNGFKEAIENRQACSRLEACLAYIRSNRALLNFRSSPLI